MNPAQEKPATEWEAEVDKLMRAQASSVEHKARKKSFDRVQEIIRREAPLLFSCTRTFWWGYSARLGNVEPSILRPQVYWNCEFLKLDSK